MTKKTHHTLRGEVIPLEDLDRPERALLDDVLAYFRTRPDWTAFESYWPRKLSALYTARGMKRQAISRTVLYRVAQDLGSRLAVIQGHARLPDYRDELASLIREKFKTQRAFCKATGLSEDLVSHVLAGRKHLAVDTLIRSLDKIGYKLHIQPALGEAS